MHPDPPAMAPSDRSHAGRATHGSKRDVLVLGGTGYLGRALLSALLARGHRVRALVRPGSEDRLPDEVEAIRGSALSAADIGAATRPNDTVVQLVGTPHPSPRKAAEFERVDLASGMACVEACRRVAVRQLVYVSVAHPAPTMQAYIAVRQRVEDAIVRAGMPATILRPWYVLGPGHRWPVVLLPLYAFAERVPSMRETARRLALVTQAQMIAALVQAVESEPPQDTARVLNVENIRQCRLQ